MEDITFIVLGVFIDFILAGLVIWQAVSGNIKSVSDIVAVVAGVVLLNILFYCAHRVVNKNKDIEVK